MYSYGAAPLPPRIAPEVVPPDLPAKPLWENGRQLRRHLKELLDRVSLLKALGEELQAFETLKHEGSTPSTLPQIKTELPIDCSDLPEKLKQTRGSRNVSLDISKLQEPIPHISTDAPNSFSETTPSLSDFANTSQKVEDAHDHIMCYDGSDSRATAIQVPDPLVNAIRQKLVLDAFQERCHKESEAVEAAIDLQDQVQKLLEPLQGALGAVRGWEHAVAAARLASKRLKIERNRRWRKRRRQRVGEARRKEQEGLEEADRKADEWRAREIAKSIARRKMEKMKEVAEKKAKEERERLEQELEMVLMVEKLQELRSLRIQKLKKQGRFLPDEDDKFMERVRAAVEEEERQAAAAADTSAAAAAIASAAEASKAAGVSSTTLPKTDDEQDLIEELSKSIETGPDDSKDSTQIKVDSVEAVSSHSCRAASNRVGLQEEKRVVVHDPFGGLPAELYHFYHGSQVDMGALIEVRRAWDAFIIPGGSHVPGHWIEAPPPADSVWASYLVQSRNKSRRSLRRSGKKVNLIRGTVPQRRQPKWFLVIIKASYEEEQRNKDMLLVLWEMTSDFVRWIYTSLFNRPTCIHTVLCRRV